MNNPYDPVNNGYHYDNDTKAFSNDSADQVTQKQDDQLNSDQGSYAGSGFNNHNADQQHHYSQNDSYAYYSNKGAYFSQPNQQYYQGGQNQYYAQSQQNKQYGNNGYYGGGYYPPVQTNNPYAQPYIKEKEKKKPRPASRGFVISAVCISLVISFFLGIFTSVIISASMPNSIYNEQIIGGGQVIVQYAPKGEEQPVITDKGIAAYVASVVSNTVVEVRTETVATDSYYGQYITQGAGSGVIVSSTEDGSHIITCAHVIEGATKVTVKLKDGTTYEADSFVCDAESDIGVIKLNVKGLPTATLGDYSKVVVGEDVVAIGNPLGTLGGSVTSGIVSALDRDIIIDGTTYHLLQTNAEINPGNSGGGLFNAKGQLIGIVNAKSSGENVEGLGFAIPIDDAQVIMKDLLEKGYVAGRVKLGFRLLEIQSKEDAINHLQYYRYFTEFGVYIIESENPNFQTGDLLVAINTETISTLTDLKAFLQKLEVGQTVTITVSRITGTNKVQLCDIELTLQEKKS